MLILWAILAEDPSAEVYYPAIVLLVLIPAALGTLFSLRVTLCYCVAVISGLILGDLVMWVPLTLGSGRSSGEAALAFLVIGLCAMPVGFLLSFILALVFLPKNMVKTVPRKYRTCAFGFSLLLVLVPLLFGKTRIDSKEAFVELVRNRPEALDNKRVGDFFLGDETLILENRTFEGTEFIESKIQNMIIRNVTFENCLFKESTFENLTLENVTFENCTFARFPSNYSDRYARFDGDICENVVFSGGNLAHLRFNAGRGDVIVKNATVKAPTKGYACLFNGGALSMRFDNCTFDGEMTLAWTEGRYQATLHVTNSRFTVPKSSLFRCSDMKAVWFEKCHIDSGSVPTGETTVIKDCYFAASVRQNFRDVTQRKRPDSEWRKQTVYMENCEFPSRKSDWGREYGATFYNQHPENDVYILGKQPRQKGVNLGLSGGRLHVFDAEIRCFDIFGGTEKAPPVEVNLKNVVIDGGKWEGEYARVDFKGMVLADGKWDDVTIFPQVNMEGAAVHALTVHNLQLPKGEPWVNADDKTFSGMSVRDTPLDISRPRVPTLAELGITDPLQ